MRSYDVARGSPRDCVSNGTSSRGTRAWPIQTSSHAEVARGRLFARRPPPSTVQNVVKLCTFRGLHDINPSIPQPISPSQSPRFLITHRFLHLTSLSMASLSAPSLGFSLSNSSSRKLSGLQQNTSPASLRLGSSSSNKLQLKSMRGRPRSSAINVSLSLHQPRISRVRWWTSYQRAGNVRLRDQRARPQQPGLPSFEPEGRQLPRRPRPLQQQGILRGLTEAAGNHGGAVRADPARPGARRRPLRGHLQLLLRRVRAHLGAGSVLDVRGHVPGRHRRVRRVRGRPRPGEAAPARVPLQDLLHLLPRGHPRPPRGAALLSGAALRRRSSPRPPPRLRNPTPPSTTTPISGEKAIIRRRYRRCGPTRKLPAKGAKLSLSSFNPFSIKIFNYRVIIF
ncbi:unnamed protein product [Musa banksii]